MKKFFRNYNFLYLLILVPFLAGCPPFSNGNSGSGGSVEVTDENTGTTVLVTSTTGGSQLDLSGVNTLNVNAITKGGTIAPKYIAVSNDPGKATISNSGPPFEVTGVSIGNTSIVVIDTANSNAVGAFNVTIIDSGEN